MDTPEGWDKVESHIKASLAIMDDGHGLWDVLSKLNDGKAQWHWHNECALVTKVIESPKGDICTIWLSAGNMEAVKEAEKYVAAWARDIGCIEMRYMGRRGWTRVNPEYEEVGIVARRKL